VDALSDALQHIRLQGAWFLNGEFREPWCVDIPPPEQLAALFLPGAERLAVCHVVVRGQCWARLPGQEPMPLHEGQVVVFPHGDAHLLGSGLRHAPVSLDHVIVPRVPELHRVSYGGSGAATLVMCGWFAYERHIPNPLVAALPRQWMASLEQQPCQAWLLPAIQYALADAAAGRPGAEAAAARIAEILFVELLRCHVAALPAEHAGWLAGVRDPLVGRCLGLLHERPAHTWTVAELAQALAVSRSVLAERFSALVGQPPMHYLKHWRLVLAARQLRQQGAALARVAASVGYASPAAFNRAFKEAFGVSPGQWRDTTAAEAEAAAP